MDNRAELLEIRDKDGATLAWWSRGQVKCITDDLNDLAVFALISPETVRFIGRLNAFFG